MKKNIKSIILLAVIFVTSSCLTAKSNINYDAPDKKHLAIVKGTIFKKEIKKSGKYYFTEYKLLVNEWLYRKNENIREDEIITLKVFGAELPEKGILITASFSPAYVPVNEEALFYLEDTTEHLSNVYTVTSGGIIHGEELDKLIVEANKND